MEVENLKTKENISFFKALIIANDLFVLDFFRKAKKNLHGMFPENGILRECKLIEREGVFGPRGKCKLEFVIKFIQQLSIKVGLMGPRGLWPMHL